MRNIGIFKRVREGEFSIVISQVVLDELKFNGIDKDKFEGFKKWVKDKLTFVYASKDDCNAAHELKLEKKMDYNDALHAILAKKAEADYIVTRNIKHFIDLSIKIRLPEEI